MSQTKKAIAKVISVKEKPFSAKEVEQLETILRSPKISWRPLKEIFVSKFLRKQKDVDNWLYRNTPGTAQNKRMAKVQVRVQEPLKKKEVTVKKNSEKRQAIPRGVSELRLPIHSWRVEDSTLIITVKNQ